MSSQQTFAQLTATLRDLTKQLRQEDREAIRRGWDALGQVDHRAHLLVARIPGVSFEEARGLIYLVMETASTEGDYTENLLVAAVDLAPQLSNTEFRDKILGLAGQSKQFDRVASLASTFFRGV